MAFLASMRVAVVCAVEPVNAIVDVVRCMRVHYIDDHLDAKPVGLVNQILEVVGGPLARRHCEEAGHVVAKAAIVSMLLDSHQLDAIIATFHHMGQDVVSEFPIGRNFAVLLTHSNVSLVYLETFRPLRSRVGEGILLSWVVEDAIEQVCLMILHYIFRPCRIFVRLPN